MNPARAFLARLPLLAGLLLLPMSSVFCQSDYEVQWSRLSPGLELARIQSNSGTFFGTALLAFRADPARFRIAVLAAEDFGKKQSEAQAICKASRATLCVNASFFDESGNALGLVVTRGIQRHPVHQSGRVLSGIFEVTRNNAKIVHRSEYDPASVLEAVQAGPRLLVNGKPVPIKDPASSRRAGLCLDSGNRILFYVTSANSLRGITISDLQSLLRHPELNCQDALNLDGGSSAQLFFDPALPGAPSQSEAINIEGGVKAPVFLGLFPRE